MRISDWSSDVCSSDLIPGLKLTVVQADGVNVEPATVDEFRFGPGETYDVLVQPKDDTYTVYAQAIDRTGYARGTLATRAGLEAPVPALDPAEWLTMARSEEHTSELQSLMRISYAVFCLKKKTKTQNTLTIYI